MLPATKKVMQPEIKIRQLARQYEDSISTPWAVPNDDVVDMSDSNNEQAIIHDDERVSCHIFPN